MKECLMKHVELQCKMIFDHIKNSISYCVSYALYRPKRLGWRSYLQKLFGPIFPQIT